MHRWLGVVLVVGLAACGAEKGDSSDVTATDKSKATSTTLADEASTTTEAAPAATTTTAAPVPEVITLAAGGEQNTDPFTLRGGSYAVAYDFGDGCYYSGDLLPISGDSTFPEQVGTGQGPVKGTTNVYNVEGGEYFVRMITGPSPSCPWSITLTQR